MKNRGAAAIIFSALDLHLGCLMEQIFGRNSDFVSGGLMLLKGHLLTTNGWHHSSLDNLAQMTCIRYRIKEIGLTIGDIMLYAQVVKKHQFAYI